MKNLYSERNSLLLTTDIIELLKCGLKNEFTKANVQDVQKIV